ncbi:hypothetical protein ACIHFD_49535 [Nonomuraea sp. NPDC051941]|uniref:hypothetical protein n=1 Tax=Nonomuraea sp. NPDC051941 TaxID=3364373 RepID=UPI0037C73C39
MLPPPTSPAEERVRQTYLDDVARIIRNEIADGGHMNRATALRIASGILASLAEHIGAVPPVLPLSAQGSLTLTGSASITVVTPRTVEATATVYTPTVAILDESGHAEDTLTVEKLPAEGLSHKQKLLLIRIQIFVVVFVALSGIVSANEDLADKLGPYLGGSALGIALLCSRQVGRAYDKKYGPGDDNADA